MGFVASKWVLIDFSPIWTNSLRFIVAAFFALPVLLFYRPKKITKSQLKWSLISGLVLFLSMLFQTFGLRYSTVAKTGFLASFYAFFTPLLGVIIYKYRFTLFYLFLVLMALLGVYLLNDLNFSNLTFGDGCTIVGAFFGAFHIMSIDYGNQFFDSSFRFNSMQIIFISFFCLPFAITLEGVPSFAPFLNINNLVSVSSLSGIIFLSLFSSFLAFAFQAKAQKIIPSYLVSMIFLLESPFAAFFGYLLLGEKITLFAIAGALVVVSSVGLTPFSVKKKSKQL